MEWRDRVGKLVTNDDGKSAYRVIGYCQSPSVELEHLETKERLSFGIGGLTAQEFVPLDPSK